MQESQNLKSNVVSHILMVRRDVQLNFTMERPGDVVRVKKKEGPTEALI